MKKIYFVASLLVVSLIQQTFAQGLVDGFMKGQRKASFAVTYSQESYDTYYVGTTETRNPNLGTVSTQSLNLYGSYGLGYDLDLIVSVPYVRAEASAGYWQKQEGLQDLSAALRWEAFDYKIGSTRLSWLFSAGYSFPLQNYVIDSPVAIGHGARSLDGRTLLHFKAGAFFLTGQFGYIRRGQVTLDRVANYYDPDNLNPNSGSKVNVPDVTDAVIRGGPPRNTFTSMVGCNDKRPTAKAPTLAPAFHFRLMPLVSPERVPTSMCPSLKKLGINAGYSTTLSGQNIGKATRFSGGVVIGI